MQTICQLCQDNTSIIMLVCSHPICIRCVDKRQQMETSLLQNKYWIMCFKCSRKTYSYDFRNLLIENHELSLLTDRSQQQLQLNESQLIAKEPTIVFHRRRSMNTIALELLHQGNHYLSPNKNIQSDNKRINTSQKKMTASTKDTGKFSNNLLILDKTNHVYRHPTPARKIQKNQEKKPNHKRCYTGILNDKSNDKILQNLLEFPAPIKKQTCTVPSKNLTQTSIYNYLLSLSYKHIKSQIQKPIIDHTFCVFKDKKKIEKNRCYSQVAIKHNIKPKQQIF